LEVVRARAEEHKHTPCIGRSHGIHAEPITFGLKVISWYAELRRHRERLRAAIHDVAVGKISGAVGTYASLPPEVEAHVMKTVGLRVDEVSTQIVSRDRHAVFFSALAALGSSIERFSVEEIRHLQRTEVREVEERFKSGQKGSSAMPHKRNPVLTENLCGIARLLRSYAQAAFENVALWHERDISHSSVERVIAPDACTLCDFMLTRFRSVMSGLVVYPDQMLRNLELTRGLVHSGTLLITLVDAGVTREEAYRMVQRNAMETWAGGATFEERVRGDEAITKALSPQALNQVFDLKRHFQHVDLIFERALKARYDA
jgi:adenylosuccinate lyase